MSTPAHKNTQTDVGDVVGCSNSMNVPTSSALAVGADAAVSKFGIYFDSKPVHWVLWRCLGAD